MSETSHQIKVKGVDKTGAAFASVKNRAIATGAQIRSMLGGALQVAGAYMGFRAVKGGIDELSRLSDVAMKTSTSVDELTQTATAMSALGIQNMGVAQLGKAFDYLAKTTGRTGMAGFMQTIGELGKIEDVAARGQAAMKIFGRGGMELMPLINAADTSVEALATVVNAMPKIPQSAANAGDAMSDAMGFAANQVKSIWLQGLGAICGWFDNEYTGGVREASLTAGNYLEYYTKVAVNKCISWFQKMQAGLKTWGEAIGTLVGGAYEKLFGSGGTWKDVWEQTKTAWSQGLDEYDEEATKIEERERERSKRFTRDFEERAIAVKKFQGAYDAAAVSIEKRNGKGLGGEGLDMALKSPAVRNELIMGGNDANRLAVLGPQLQSETKKQTALLEQIANNTKSTADNTESQDDIVKVEDFNG